MHSAFIASTNMKLKHGLILIGLTSLLLGCEQLGIEDPTVEKAREEAEGKAIGSGCRQTGRVLEECYQLNRKAPKAANIGRLPSPSPSLPLSLSLTLSLSLPLSLSLSLSSLLFSSLLFSSLLLTLL